MGVGMKYPSLNSLQRFPTTGDEFMEMVAVIEKRTGKDFDEVCRRISIPPGTVRGACDRGELPAFYLKRVVVMLRELDGDEISEWGMCP
jgi:hypothetical protein